MKSLLPLFFFSILSSVAHAQSVVMPAMTKAAIRDIQKDLSQNRNTPSQRVLDFYPVYERHGQRYIATLCKVNAQFSKTEAIADGLDVGAVIGHVVTMRVPLQRFREDFSFPGVEYMELAEKIEPQLDVAVVDARANLVHRGVGLPQAYTGKDVLVGIVDWGFDYTHPAFYDTSLTNNRILAAWDQVRQNGTPPPGYSSGSAYLTPEELAAAAHDTISVITDYHGTHVAGIAGGSGGGTAYRGMAFGAQLLFSQMNLDVSSPLDAYQWMYEIAQAQGKRLVINNSWGGYRGYPLDGTSLLSQAIDALIDMGVVITFSAGNNGGINFHLKKSFAADSVRTRIQGFEYSADHNLWGQTIPMWGQPGHSFAVQLRALDNTNALLVKSDLFHTATAPPYIDTFMVTGADTIFYRVTTDAAHPLNQCPQMTLDVRCTNTALKMILYAEADSGTVHFWNTTISIFGRGNTGKGFTAPTAGYTLGDRNYGIGYPAVTNKVITCAAHIKNFGLANFSSYGPRIDETLKPDISAPGQDVCSAINSFATESFVAVTAVDFNGREYEFVRLSGTSMSAPMVAGAAALLLEADPSLSPAEVKSILLSYARQDNHTGTIGPEGHTRWGHGKLDAYNIVQAVTSTATGQVQGDRFSLYPNPAHDQLYIVGELSGHEQYRLLSMDGRCIISGEVTSPIPLAECPPGIYVLEIKGPAGFETRTVIVQ